MASPRFETVRATARARESIQLLPIHATVAAEAPVHSASQSNLCEWISHGGDQSPTLPFETHDREDNKH